MNNTFIDVYEIDIDNAAYQSMLVAQRVALGQIEPARRR
jgi:hypothetical protein